MQWNMSTTNRRAVSASFINVAAATKIRLVVKAVSKVFYMKPFTFAVIRLKEAFFRQNRNLPRQKIAVLLF